MDFDFKSIDHFSKRMYSFSGSIRVMRAEFFSKCIHGIGCSIEYISYNNITNTPYFEDYIYPDIGVESYYQRIEKGTLERKSKVNNIFVCSSRNRIFNILERCRYGM